MNAKNFWKFGILLKLLFIQLSIADEIAHAPNDFNIIVFTQQWAKTACIRYRKPANQCYLPRNDEWSIHGVWPSKSQQQGPADCRRDLPFKPQELKSIRNQLDAKWSNIHGPNAEGFWKHEWEKHGTCAVVLPQLNTQLKYFQKGLGLHKKYNIKSILEKARIVPGKNYPIQDILKALNKGLGKSPLVTCAKDSGKQFLHEVRICLDKQLQLISCQGHLQETNCDSRSNVEYPRR